MMKKLLSYVLVFAMALTGVTVAAEADEGEPARVIPYLASDHTADDPRLTLRKGQLVVAADATTVLVPESIITTGAVYSYPIYRVDRDYDSVSPTSVEMTPVDDNMLGTASLRLREVKEHDGAVSAKIENVNGAYHLVVEAAETHSADLRDIEFVILPYGDGAAATGLTNVSVLLKAGSPSVSGEVIETYRAGDYVIIPSSAPVILREQFYTLTENYNGELVPLMDESGDWLLTGRFTGTDNANFLTSNAVVDEVINSDPEHAYKFLSFPAGVTLRSNAEMRIRADDIYAINDSKPYAYLYRNGVLTPINANYDEITGEVVFNTNYLGTFVISSGDVDTSGLTANAVAANSFGVEIPNPATGSADAVMNATIAFALFSLAVAFAMMRIRGRD